MNTTGLFMAQEQDVLLASKITRCVRKDVLQQSKKHKATSTRDFHLRVKSHHESGKRIFRECQGTRFRKRCKHGSGEAVSVARLYKAPLVECDERRGKTLHERKLHRIALQKQTRITRHEAFKITW